MNMNHSLTRSILKHIIIDIVIFSATLPISSGTGFAWDREGHVITNNHVVAGAKQIEVSIFTKKDVENENSKFYPTSNDGRTPGIDGEHH